MSSIAYMYITGRPDVARMCEDAGVERIFVDMEWMGKAERQGHIDSVKSFHTPENVAAVRSALTRAQVLVRVNPAHAGTRAEVAGAIEAGADLVMLPMARTAKEARLFIEAAGGRAKTVLLLETRGAEENLEAMLEAGFDEVHIGLNDLSLEYGLPFMFTLLADGTVERLCARIRRYRIPYGFGGVARLGGGRLPSEHVLMEHVRLGSTRAILSRSFFNADGMGDLAGATAVFSAEFAKLREAEKTFRAATERDFLENSRIVGKLCA